VSVAYRLDLRPREVHTLCQLVARPMCTAHTAYAHPVSTLVVCNTSSQGCGTVGNPHQVWSCMSSLWWYDMEVVVPRAAGSALQALVPAVTEGPLPGCGLAVTGFNV
jgi:hypothetical protein